ncbi:phage portal protein [Schlesneria paludicola]|uniref:phage portal protein n=1 Tax=Schlesneria paludicola TaxID=360056 RepID=UPI00029B423F|nr:phage portal protein [Schlesneria paludicola]
MSLMNWFARWTRRTSKSLGSLGVGVRAALGGASPGGWASDHREETAHYTGFNYVAIHAIAAQVAGATVTVFADSCHQVQRQARRKSLAGRCGSFRQWKSTYGADDRETDSLSSEHPLVQLLKRPNPYESGASFRYRQAQQIRLTGTCLVWNVPNRAGMTCERYVIPTGMASPVSPTQELPAGGWRISPVASRYTPIVGDGFVDGPSWYRILGQIVDARQVQVIRLPHPWYLDDGQSPLSAGAKWVDAGEAVDTARFHQLRNGIDPSIVWNLPPDVSPDQDEIDRLQMKISSKYGGPTNVGRVMVAQNGTSITPLSVSPKEMCYSEGFQDFKAAILALHQTPPVAVGLQEPGAYAAYNASMKAWRHAAIQPLCDMIAESETEYLAPQFGEGLTVEIESDTVDDTELIERQLQNDLAAKTRTRNEWRAVRGMPPLPGPLGEELVGIGEGGGSGKIRQNSSETDDVNDLDDSFSTSDRDPINRNEDKNSSKSQRLQRYAVSAEMKAEVPRRIVDDPAFVQIDSGESDERHLEIIVEILYGRFGEALIPWLEETPSSSEKTFDPELHPRDERGRFVHRGSGAANEAAYQLISNVLRQPDSALTSDPKIANALFQLSRSQLEALHREYGVVPLPRYRDHLIESVRARLDRWSLDPEPESKPSISATTSKQVDVFIQEPDVLNRILGRTMGSEQWSGLVGAQPGARVHVLPVRSNHAKVVVEHPDYLAIRQIRADSMTNVSLKVRSEVQSEGIATRILSEQVEMAVALKFDRIEAFAAGNGTELPDVMPDGERDAGFYAWARLGYEGNVREVIDSRQNATDEEFATIADFYDRFGDVKKISEMMLTPERREWWRKFGGPFEATFDLRRNSRSRKVLAAYVAERAARPKLSEGKQWLPSDEGRHLVSAKIQNLESEYELNETPDLLTADDEALLDRIWDRFGQEVSVFES